MFLAIPTFKGDSIYFAGSRNVALVHWSPPFYGMGNFVPQGEKIHYPCLSIRSSVVPPPLALTILLPPPMGVAFHIEMPAVSCLIPLCKMLHIVGADIDPTIWGFYPPWGNVRSIWTDKV